MAPTAQKPLVGQFDWPAMNPPQNSSQPLHHPSSSSSHSHYESPFQQVDMRPGVLHSATDFFSRQFSACSAHLSRQPVLLTVFLVACAVALLALALFLCGAKRSLEREGQRLYQCRHHYYSDDDGDDDCCDDQDQGFMVCEKHYHHQAPVPGESLWSETRREFGLKLEAGNTGAAAGVSVKPDLPPFHVSVRLI